MRRLIALSIFTFAFLFSIQSTAQLSGNYTINSAATTSGTNFQSFNDLLSSLTTNGVSGAVNVNVVPGSGPYNERVIFTNYTGASNTNRLTINGNAEKIKFTPTASDFRIVGFDSASYITLKNLNIIGKDTLKGYGIHLKNKSKHIIIEGCAIDLTAVISYSNSGGIGTHSAGILASSQINSIRGFSANSCSNTTIRNNTIIGSILGSAGVGIQLESGNLPDSSNSIESNIIKDFYESGIRLKNQVDCNVEGNDISTPNRNDFDDYLKIIYITGKSENSKISRNRIHDLVKPSQTSTSINEIVGIYIYVTTATAAKPLEIYNNLLYNFNSLNADATAIQSFAGDYVNILHNSIELTANAPLSNSITGVRINNPDNGISVNNNIISIIGTSTEPKYGVRIDYSNPAVNCEYNNVFINTGGTNEYYGRLATYSAPTIMNWRGTNYGQNSTEVDPQFLESEFGEMAFQNTTLQNAGKLTSVNNDFFNKSRDSTPDMGAINYGCLGVNLINDTVDSTSVLINWNSPIASKWEVELDTIKFDPGTAANRYSVSNSSDTTFQSLVKGKTYYYSIRSICATGDTSYWSRMLDFHIRKGLSGLYTIDSASPTALRNFQSFTDLANRLNKDGVADSVTVSVTKGSGPYNENFILNTIFGASTNNRLTIKGNNEKISAPPNTLDYRIIGLNNSQYVTIDSLIIVSQDVYRSFGIHLSNFADHNIISNCTINMNSVQNFGSAGIYATDSYYSSGTSSSTPVSNLRIDGCTIFGNITGILLEVGLFNNYATGNIIQNNQIQNFNGYGINVRNQSNLIIEKNKISRPDPIVYTNYISSSITGILISGRSNNLSVQQNEIAQIYSLPPTLDGNIIGIATSSNSGTTNAIMKNNVIRDLFGNESIHAIDNRIDGIKLYHNTINIKNPLNLAVDIVGLYYVNTNGIELKNNLIAIDGNTNASYYAIQEYFFNSTLSSNYNNFHLSPSSSTAQNFAKINNTTYATIRDWRSLTARDQNSLTLDPQFVSSENLTPLNIGLKGAGTNLNVTKDFYDKLRKTSPDMGAIAIDTKGDSLVPYYPISIINTEDSTGLLDSVYVKCATSGSVLSENLSENGLAFYISENASNRQEGIKVFSNNYVPTILPQVGDSVLIRGFVFQDKGLASFFFDSLAVIKSSAYLPVIDTIDNPNDSTENKLVRLNNLQVIQPLDSSSNWLVAINGVDTIRIYISEANSLKDSLLKYHLTVGDSICSITGIGGQYDENSPFLENYIMEGLSFEQLDIENCQCFSAIGNSYRIFGRDIHLKWTSYPSADKHIISYDSSGFTLGQSSIPPLLVSNNDTLLTNLNKKWRYDYFIGTICLNGDTAWSSRKSFYIKNTLDSGRYTIDSSRVTDGFNFQSFLDFKSRLENEGIIGPIIVDVVSGSGPYNQAFILNEFDGMSAANPVVIRGNGETIEYAPTAADRRIVGLNGVKHFTIDSLTIVGLSSQYGFGIQLNNEADSNMIKNCRIDLSLVNSGANTFENSAGIIVNGLNNRVTAPGKASYNRIKNNTILGSATNGMMYGIYLNGFPNFNHSNEISGNSIIDFYSDGITIINQSNLLVSKNKINKPNLISAIDVFGIYISGDHNQDLKIEKNTINNISNPNNSSLEIHGIFLNRINDDSANTHNIENNLIYSFHSTGKVYGIKTNDSKDIRILHNVIDFNNSNIQSGTSYGYHQDVRSSDIIFQNNIISISRNNSSSPIYGIYLRGTTASNIFNYNNVHLNSTNGPAFYGYLTANKTTLADWRAVSLYTYGINSLAVDPFFFSNTLKPRNMLLNNTAAPTVVNTDFLDIIRGNTPDIGAYEIDTSFLSQLPFQAISTINKEDTNGVADSLGHVYQTSGVVISQNFKESKGNSFYIEDRSNSTLEGLNVYTEGDTSLYTPALGDSIRAFGILEQEMGLTRLNYFSIQKIGVTSSISPLTILTPLDESTESILVKYLDLKVLAQSQIELELLTAANDTIIVELNEATNIQDSLNLFPLSVGDSICSLIGIGSQFDSTTTYFDDYILRPRSYDDFSISSNCSILTSINQRNINAESFKVYPNPTSNDVWVKDLSFSGAYKIRLYNSLGELTREEISSASKFRVQLNATSGFYFLEVEKNGRSVFFKVIKN